MRAWAVAAWADSSGCMNAKRLDVMAQFHRP